MSEVERIDPPDNGKPRVDDHQVDLDTWLAFLEMTDADAKKLRQLAPKFRSYAEPFVEAFYKHLLSFEETAGFLSDPQQVTRLKTLQKEHLESMFAAEWDEDYLNQRRKVGKAHADNGIEPHLFLGGYNQYIQHSFRYLAEEGSPEVQQFFQQIVPLLKAIIFDIGITLDAYFAQLTEEMRSALDMYWRANNELKQFAQLASHDLKTPLATVANLCEEAIDEFGDDMPEEARALISLAVKRTYRMSATIDELLAATIAAVDGSPNAEISGEDFLNDAIDRVRPLLKEKNITLVVADQLPTVQADKVRLREAFYNLLSNAAKFVDKVPGRIEISARIEQNDCIYTVADNGPGIPANELERIFVPFRRLPQHRGEPGSGLGLYFTKCIIEQQGGRIWAESILGEGTQFHVQLSRGSTGTVGGVSDGE
ncbi:MAG: hypothetical protein IID44_19895 [Planctomycetes bacterium]|nr:hypothetical protein [Planctomycetota bacterium]